MTVTPTTPLLLKRPITRHKMRAATVRQRDLSRCSGQSFELGWTRATRTSDDEQDTHGG